MLIRIKSARTTLIGDNTFFIFLTSIIVLNGVTAFNRRGNAEKILVFFEHLFSFAEEVNLENIEKYGKAKQ